MAGSLQGCQSAPGGSVSALTREAVQAFLDGLEQLSRSTGVELRFYTGRRARRGAVDAPWLVPLEDAPADGLYLVVGDGEGYNFDRVDLSSEAYGEGPAPFVVLRPAQVVPK